MSTTFDHPFALFLVSYATRKPFTRRDPVTSFEPDNYFLSHVTSVHYHKLRSSQTDDALQADDARMRQTSFARRHGNPVQQIATT